MTITIPSTPAFIQAALNAAHEALEEGPNADAEAFVRELRCRTARSILTFYQPLILTHYRNIVVTNVV